MVPTVIRPEKIEKYNVGLGLGEHRPLILVYSASEEIEDQENAVIDFEDLLYDSRSMMEGWRYKEYCKQLIKLIKSTYKDIK